MNQTGRATIKAKQKKICMNCSREFLESYSQGTIYLSYKK